MVASEEVGKLHGVMRLAVVEEDLDTAKQEACLGYCARYPRIRLIKKHVRKPAKGENGGVVLQHDW